MTWNTKVDFSDIKGHEHVKRGFEVAVTGGHNVLLIGPPKSGKSLFSMALPSITPAGCAVTVNHTWPCPCGYFTDPQHECNCTPQEIMQHIRALNQQMLDRTDIHLEIPRLNLKHLSPNRRGEPSEVIRERIEIARFRTRPEETDKEANELFKLAILELGISPRSFDKILRVAGTIASMDNKTIIEAHHLSEAISYRSLDRNLWG